MEEDSINQDIKSRMERIENAQVEIMELERKVVTLAKCCYGEVDSLSVLLAKYIKCREK